VQPSVRDHPIMMRQVEESIELQNVAAARAKQISRVALPGIVA
jgi:hypothetical protein